jgi:hypothetical protein
MRYRKEMFFAVAVVALAGNPALAQHVAVDPVAALSDADCGTLACRPLGSLDALDVHGQKISLPVPKSPYVTRDGTIVIYPGETLTFAFQPSGDTLGPATYLAKPGGNASNGISGDRLLGSYTSTCPLISNVMGNEMWQQPLGPILLSNIRFLPDAGATMVCD